MDELQFCNILPLQGSPGLFLNGMKVVSNALQALRAGKLTAHPRNSPDTVIKDLV